MGVALERVGDGVWTHFEGLCGSDACHLTGPHAHEDCPQCRRPMVRGLTDPVACGLCARILYPRRLWPTRVWLMDQVLYHREQLREAEAQLLHLYGIRL
jgi:hypothetical protein